MIKGDYDSVFFMDMTEGYEGLVLKDVKKFKESLNIGDYYNIDLSRQPQILDMAKSNRDEVFFERNDNFPYDGNNYIACKPILIKGKTRAIVGITYNWNNLNESLLGTVLKTMILSVGGMLLVMGIMLTIKECTDVIHGLSEHTVRQLVKQGKIKSVRTGIGKSGKILVNKDDLVAYFAA